MLKIQNIAKLLGHHNFELSNWFGHGHDPARGQVYGLGHDNGHGHGLEMSWFNKGVAGKVWNGLVLFIFPSIV